MAATSPPSRTPRTDAERPAWFRAFLTDRATRKPSLHTLEAYRHDFDAIAALVVGDPDRIRALLVALVGNTENGSVIGTSSNS